MKIPKNAMKQDEEGYRKEADNSQVNAQINCVQPCKKKLHNSSGDQQEKSNMFPGFILQPKRWLIN